MAQPKMIQANAKKLRLGVQHITVFVLLIATIFIFVYRWFIPMGIAGFVLPLFSPTQEKQNKIGFVQFNGLVWASTSKENESAIKGKRIEIEKKYVNKEYIFDFSFVERTEAQHNYAKESGEFYCKSEILGENAILLEPMKGFSILAFVIALLFGIFITMVLPPSIGFMSVLFERQIENTKVKIRLQTGFSNEIVELLTLPDSVLVNKEIGEVRGSFHLVWDRTVPEDSSANVGHHVKFDDIFNESVDLVAFRKEVLYERIREFFSDFVIKEIEDTRDGILWKDSRWKVGAGLRLYMAHHFTEKYANNVTGLAYGGAAVLIIAVGIRGLKFIPPQRPSWILFAIFLEFSMLSLMAVTLFYTEEEERMDKMLKKMEDANRSQLDVLRGQQADLHQLASALIGQASDIIKSRVESAISTYLTSSNQVEKVVAEQIANKIMVGLREQMVQQSGAPSHGHLRR